MPQAPTRAVSSKDLPPSVEGAYYRKCIDLRRRITDIEENNDGTRLRITRLNRGIQKMRLERAFLLEQLNKHMEYNVDDSDRSSSPPPTPTDKPLRSKRSHNRKGTPPLGGSAEGGANNNERTAMGGDGRLGLGTLPHGMNPMSSAQSTPDASGRPQNSGYFGAVGAATATATSPHTGVNGVPPTLPALHALAPLQPQQAPSQRAYFDPAYDEQRPTPAAAAAAQDEAGRRRAHSGAALQPPAADAAPAPPHNGDTDMTDAAFIAVNHQGE